MSAQDMVTNSHMLQHRARRARLLAEAARKLDVTPEQARLYTTDWWHALARVIRLGGDPPSPATITQALGRLAYPDVDGLVMPQAVPPCGLCNEPLGSDEPVERHLNRLVHAVCQHNFEQGFDGFDDKESATNG